MHPREQPAQRAMIRLVEGFDPAQRVVDRNALVVDFLRVADHARHGAEPAGDPHRTGVGKGRQASLEHARIELVGLAVDVDITAREVRPHQRIAARNDAPRQVVDEAVLRTPQRRQVEPRGLQEVARIDAAGMRRVEQHRPAPVLRLHDLERRIELVVRWIHGRGHSRDVRCWGWLFKFRSVPKFGPFQRGLRVHCSWRKRHCQAYFHPLFTSLQANGRRGQNPGRIEQNRPKVVARWRPRRASSPGVVTRC